MRTIIRFALGCALAASLLSGPACADPMKLNLISGPVTGSWYVGMGIVGKIISDAYPGTEITMLPGGASANPIRCSRGQADIGILQVALGTAAREGMAPFKEKVDNLNSLISWSDFSPLSFVVREDAGVSSIEDIRNRKVPLRIAVGLKGGGGDTYGRWIFGEYGFGWEDIQSWGGQVYFNNYDDMTNMAKDGLVDMIIWLGPGESWFLSEITKDIKMKWLPINEDVRNRVHEKYGMALSAVPGGLYSGRVGGTDIPTVAEITGLVVRADMPEQQVYDITKAICEGRDDLVKGFPQWGGFDPARATENLPYPLHPGAERYYREAGIIK